MKFDGKNSYVLYQMALISFLIKWDFFGQFSNNSYILTQNLQKKR